VLAGREIHGADRLVPLEVKKAGMRRFLHEATGQQRNLGVQVSLSNMEDEQEENEGENEGPVPALALGGAREVHSGAQCGP
jgi:hypothetical protein